MVAMRNGGAENCGSCRFFKRVPNMRGGLCRSRAPVPILIGMAKDPITGNVFPQVNTFWPQIPDTEWCGSYDHGIDVSAIDISKLGAVDLDADTEERPS